MAEVFRPTYTATDPKTGKRGKKKSRTWHIRYYTPDGQRLRVKGYKDRKATENLAAELERRAARLAAGIVEPSDIHAKTPLVEQAQVYQRFLLARGNTPQYVKQLTFRLGEILAHCRFIRLADVQASAVTTFLGDLRKNGTSIKTANDYLAAVKGFTRWLVRDKRAIMDALAGLSCLPNGDTDIRHARRDFSVEELQLLLASAKASKKSRRKLSGLDRYFLYLVAAATGLRAGELASLTPERFSLNGSQPVVTVYSSCTKNRKLAVQPLPLDVADALKPFLKEKPANQPVWPGKWKSRAFLMIQKDMAEARKTWLEGFKDRQERAEREQSDFLVYVDSEGRYADFHGLRHSYLTMLGKIGLSPKEHQDLARHSSYNLTCRYTHSKLYDLGQAVQGLPSMVSSEKPQADVQTMAATGTDGQKNLGPNLGLQPAVLGDFERQAETKQSSRKPTKNPGKIAVFASFPGIGKQSQKVEPTGVEPVVENSYPSSSKTLPSTGPSSLAHPLAQKVEKHPDLARLIDAWPTLSDPIRRAILTLADG